MKYGLERTKALRMGLVVLAACVCAAIVGLIFFGHDTLAQQLNVEQFAPQPEHFSELYFTDFRHLPVTLAPGTPQTVTFTVRSYEAMATTYRYDIVAQETLDSPAQTLVTGRMTLAAKHAKTINQNITIPSFTARLLISVKLQYRGVAFGAQTASLETQSIHYWVTRSQTDH